MPLADNTKLMARVPVIPDDFLNKIDHKEHELVMDFEENDLYVKNGGEYINITGKIKDSIKEIQDGSVVVHIVTEDTLPPIKERPTNHWYYVITKSEEFGTGENVAAESYIYYGVVDDTYATEKNYVLIAQNMITGSASLKMMISSGYTACFYVPISLSPRFTDDSGEVITYTIADRLYALNTSSGTYVAYDVYMLNVTASGEITINVDISGSNYFTITFDSNEKSIQGLKLPDPIEVLDGDVIGSISNPTWDEPRYLFTGWSTSSINYTPIDTTTYKPEKDMVLFAWFEFDASANKLEYYANYISDTGMLISPVSMMSADSSESNTVNIIKDPKYLGTFCSVANKDEVISAKKFNGYNTPDGQAVTEDKEQLVFLYTPIEYSIKYELDGGKLNAEVKEKYTVEDSYIPPIPVKENHTFNGWNPEKIEPGTTGDIIFTASYIENAVLIDGASLNKVFNDIQKTSMNEVNDTVPQKEQIMAIQIASSLPSTSIAPYNISSTSSPIYAWWVDSAKAVMIYSNLPIYCNNDMSGAFEGCSALRDISALEYWTCKENTKITNLFKDCILLSDTDPVENWANGKFSDFSGAFDNTVALSAGRIPTWYRWFETIYYSSVNGGYQLDIVRDNFIPGQELYPKSFEGYNSPTSPIVIDKPNEIYTFNYNPIEYNISYVLNGGTLVDTKKEKYTIEDDSYFPPAPYKEGFVFDRWIPECIESGNVGNVTFIAQYRNE